LQSIISLHLLHPRHFNTGILANESLSGILLYGPPGTGKTMVCRALAHEFGIPMLLVKPSDIFDMFVGESEKHARAVFGLAHRLAPCIVFIDEVDTLFAARTSDGTFRNEILTEFMQAMDGLHSNGNKVVVIGATNRPFDLDTAILRRLPRRMLVDLPGEAEREKILRIYLRSETCSKDVHVPEIANRTEYYSGSDLKDLCVTAALEAVNDSILRSSNISIHPTTEHQDHAISNDPLRVINMAHIRRAYDLVTPSFSPEANAELYKW
ncbi:AAA-domain-containing protein, partial [Tricholoma matsutake]